VDKDSTPEARAIEEKRQALAELESGERGRRHGRTLKRSSKPKIATIIGYVATLIVGFGAFRWVDEWWATLLLLVVALSIPPLLRGLASLARPVVRDVRYVDEADIWEQEAYARGLSPEEVDALSADYAPGRSPPEEAVRKAREVGLTMPPEKQGDIPGFGDRVRIAPSDETSERGFAGRSGIVYGESIPSSSGAGPVIGDRGEDFALSVFFEDTDEEEWFAPHLVEVLDHGGAQAMTIDAGPSFVRDPDGACREVGGATEVGDVLNPGLELGGAVPDAKGRIRRWLGRRA
jgi:hypothetical protein